MKIKIQHIACLSVLMLLLSTNCTDKENTKSITDSNAILQEMTDKKIADVFSGKNLNINIDSLFLYKKNTSESLVYLLNADCSFCVGQFLDFISYYNKENIQLPLITIVEEGYTEAVKYYMKQVRLRNTNLTIIENNDKKIVSEDLESYSGIIFHYKGKRLISSVSLK